MTGTTGSAAGTYALSAKVKLGAAYARGKGSFTGQFTFSAAEGASLRAALEGPGLDPTGVVLSGPGGVVAVTVAGAPGGAKFAATLTRDTGTYTVSYTAADPVAASWSVKLPQGPVVAE